MAPGTQHPAPSAGTLSPPRAQPAHSTSARQAATLCEKGNLRVLCGAWVERSYVGIPQIGIAMGFLYWRCELAERAFKTGGGDGRALVPLPVLSAGKAHRRWCQLVVRAVEVP